MKWLHFCAGGCVLALLGCVPLLAIVHIRYGTGTNFYNNALRSREPLEFDRAQWIANPEPALSVPLRYRMARSLARSRRLIGLEYWEVEAMLGPPTDRISLGYTLNEVEAILGRPADGVPSDFPKREYPAWYLMPSGSDRLCLMIRTGTDGRVVSVEVPGG